MHRFRAQAQGKDAVTGAILNHVIRNAQRRLDRVKRQCGVLGKIVFRFGEQFTKGIHGFEVGVVLGFH